MSKTKKISFRTASIPLVENIRKKFNVHFPVGGQLCTICRNVTENSNCTDNLDDFTDGNTDIEEAEVQEDEDVTFHSAKIVDQFGCSRYLVEKSRQLKAQNSVWGNSEHSSPAHRMKLDMSKVEHFLDFLFENKYLEDTYYGTTTLKLEDGTMFEIP